MENTATYRGKTSVPNACVLMGIGGTNGGAAPLPDGITRYCPGVDATPEPTKNEGDLAQTITEHAITSWN